MTTSRKHTVLRAAGTTLVLMLAFLLALMLASHIVRPKNNAPENGMIDAEAFGILGEPENSIDVLILGDSEAFTSMNPMQMWHEYGFTSYVCSTKQQRLPYSATFLLAATQHQKPRIVVIETNALFAPFSVNDVLKQTAKNLFPVFEYHDRWKHLTLDDFTQMPQTTWTDPMKGFTVNTSTVPADGSQHMRHRGPRETLLPYNEFFLRNMIDYCRSIGATPVLVSTPSTKNWNLARHDCVEQWARNNGVAYYDLNMEPYKASINWETESRDGGDHLNFYGATKVTDLLGEILSTDFDLVDRRDDPDYESWRFAYVRYLTLIED